MKLFFLYFLFGIPFVEFFMLIPANKNTARRREKIAKNEELWENPRTAREKKKLNKNW